MSHQVLNSKGLADLAPREKRDLPLKFGVSLTFEELKLGSWRLNTVFRPPIISFLFIENAKLTHFIWSSQKVLLIP